MRIRPGEIEVEALLFTAQIERFCNLWFVHDWEVDRRVVVKLLAWTWYAAFTGPEPKRLARPGSSGEGGQRRDS